MSKRLNAKYKCNRRYGANIWGRSKSPVVKRDYPPGQHGPKGAKRSTDYGVQLSSKQKLKFFYGNISEKQFRNIFRQAKYGRASTGDSFLSLLERRLDAFVFRMGWAPTPFAARQFINHGHILVNDRRVNIGSVRLCAGDVVAIKEKMHHHPMIIESLAQERSFFPDYVTMDESKRKATLTRLPEADEITYPFSFDRNKIIELYSRSI
jgi:small subunit ribosomal protein S4